jgi:hypothetical protein
MNNSKLQIIDQSINALSEKELEIFKSLFNYDNVYGISQSSTHGPTYRSSYVRMQGFKFWDDEEAIKLDDKVKYLNENLDGKYMEVTEYVDYENEWDNDRYYPAYFSFKIIKK